MFLFLLLLVHVWVMMCNVHVWVPVMNETATKNDNNNSSSSSGATKTKIIATTNQTIIEVAWIKPHTNLIQLFGVIRLRLQIAIHILVSHIRVFNMVGVSEWNELAISFKWLFGLQQTKARQIQTRAKAHWWASVPLKPWLHVSLIWVCILFYFFLLSRLFQCTERALALNIGFYTHINTQYNHWHYRTSVDAFKSGFAVWCDLFFYWPTHTAFKQCNVCIQCCYSIVYF